MSLNISNNEEAYLGQQHGIQLAPATATVQFTPDAVSEPRPPAFSDDALALRFAELHANDLRYVAVWGRWFHWIGTHWRQDDTLHAVDLVRAACRKAAAECSDGKLATAIASSK